MKKYRIEITKEKGRASSLWLPMYWARLYYMLEGKWLMGDDSFALTEDRAIKNVTKGFKEKAEISKNTKVIELDTL